MGRKNKKARDDYWESEYLNDMEQMEGEADEEVEHHGEVHVEPKAFDVDDIGEIDVADDLMDDVDEDELLVKDKSHEGHAHGTAPAVEWTDSEEDVEELDYTVGELDHAVAKVRAWLKERREKDELPTSGDALMKGMEPLCKAARQLPSELYMTVLLDLGAVFVVDQNGNQVAPGAQLDPTKNRLAFCGGMQRKCSSGKARERAEQEHPVVADCLMQMFSHLKSVQDRPDTTEGVVNILKQASRVEKDIPIEDVLTIFVDEGSIVLEEATAKGGLKITRATYHFDKLSSSEQKGSGMSFKMIILVLLMILPALLAKFMK